ncbi:MAG: leucine-rich repeat domain-containing protein [Deltaproteobacteria bacterium]|nr:leucine-rich repeat domain-containing protein [Deltaproteobacteria bacterium]
MENSKTDYSLRISQPDLKKPIEIKVTLDKGESFELDRFGKLDLAQDVLVWLPVKKEFEGHTKMFIYRIRQAKWEQLPVRWVCRRRCTLQHISYQTTLSGGPPNTRVFYETEVDGQYLKSTYAWDGKCLKPLEIEEPRSRDALSRGYKEPELLPVCQRTPQVRNAIVKRAGVGCEEIGPDQLVRIKRLSLDRKRIKRLKNGDFSGLSELTDLSLMNNPMKKLPAGVFDGLFKLNSLNFQECRLITIPEGIFKQLGSLKSLYLNHNRLRMLPAGAFEGLNSLTFLSLNHNRLRSLPSKIFKPLPKRCNVYLSNNKASLERTD